MNIKRSHIILIIIFVVVFLLILIFINNSSKPNFLATETSPINKQTDVLVNTNIEISFNKYLSDEEKNNLNLKINPKTEVEIDWNNGKYIINPKTDLNKSTLYTLDLYYKNTKLNSFSFTTMKYTIEELNKIGQEQSQADYIAGQSIKDFVSKNPWYVSLPITNSSYTIVYDFDKKQFRIRIKNKTLNESEKQQVLENALNDLKRIGVTSVPIPYYILN